MELFEAIEKRRSVRRFKPEKFPDESIQEALQAAVLAPNSSNTQTWDFYWVQSADKKKLLVENCLSQSAARTASDLIVVVSDSKLWRRSNSRLIDWVKTSKAHPSVETYYKKLIPIMYRYGVFSILAPIKWLLFTAVGLFRPITRGPTGKQSIDMVSVKSAALACENFVLAITALGGATCMMEGFDECRVRRLLKLSCSARVVMVIGVGYEAQDGVWGKRFRIPFDEVVHRI